ncbi:SCO5389 family protein [Polymorphospora sp. NPDC050346]|uniref:SCO5389 family protein n=1 Tax=Polymorphospora sp. NPDC050346 TaxID=3155780 RepID=UPI00341028D4
MSLDVPAALLSRAATGEVDDAEFVDCVRHSLPYAWTVVSDVAARATAGTADFADHAVPPPGEAERGQLLRALASDAIRGGLERHFGVRLAFQNCHRVAAFRPAAVGGEAYERFVSPVGQIRNQSPELRDC